MKVEFVSPKQREVSGVVIWDIFVDEVPLDLVPFELRVPNATLWVYLDRGQRPIHVQGSRPAKLEGY